MKQRIAYFLYTEKEEEYECKEIYNDRFHITIIKFNPKTRITYGQRYNIVYCDAAFTQSIRGQEIIRECIKPSASIREAEFYLI